VPNPPNRPSGKGDLAWFAQLSAHVQLNREHAVVRRILSGQGLGLIVFVVHVYWPAARFMAFASFCRAIAYVRTAGIGPESIITFEIFRIFYEFLNLEQVIIICRMRMWSTGVIFFSRFSFALKLAQFASKKL
jgi:hypothetical protein